MRKQWVKREQLYEKPFYKQKLKMTFLAVFVMAFVFFAYQLFYIKQLQRAEEDKSHMPFINNFQENVKQIIRGIRLKDYKSYNPTNGNTFNCLSTGKAIPLDKVNDDYCDCIEDGSDETQTNACLNGIFYCAHQKRHLTGRGRDNSIPSSRINDGICDCCDGSDEWQNVKSSCVNVCSS